MNFISFGLTLLCLHGVLTFEKSSNRNQTPSANNRYLDYQLYEVFCEDEKVSKLIELQANEDRENIDIWLLPSSNQPGHILISPEFETFFVHFLEKENMKFTKFCNDWYGMFNMDFILSPRNETKYKLHKRFLSYSEIETLLGKYNRTKSKIAKLEVIGQSNELRKLFLMKISINSSKPIIWLDGGIHAREWISVSTAIFVIHKLLRPSPIANFLLARYQFYILPLINPDGYEYSRNMDRLWRKNRSKNDVCFGVDLNRNFAYRWGGKGASKFSCSDIFRGNSSNSEPETRAISQTLTLLGSKIKAYISLHSYGQFIFAPFGYQKSTYPSDYSEIMRVAKIAADNLKKYFRINYTYGNSAELMYPASGGSSDFAKGQLNISFTFTIELPDKGRFGFELPENKIKNIGNQMLQILIDLSYNM